MLKQMVGTFKLKDMTYHTADDLSPELISRVMQMLEAENTKKFSAAEKTVNEKNGTVGQKASGRAKKAVITLDDSEFGKY